ncbi:MAG: MBL fold metallo-hydrolase [Leptospirales bacterium]|nr:MBL fold metallo-hydrolase [Leptospirales bacterium]
MALEQRERKYENIYLIDTMQFNSKNVTSVFCYSDGKRACLMDIGTSDSVETVLDALVRFGISLNNLEGIVLSHYHFDHGGGSSELWKRMRDINKNFKVYTNSITKMNLQNAEGHINGAKTTFGKFVGTMDYIPDEAFCIVELDDFVPLEFSDGAKIKLLHTPGHTPDHCSPSVIYNDRTIFMFAGEAVGTVYTDDKILSTPTSMPPNFKFNDYINSMGKIKNMKPEIMGLCHYGMITGERDINFMIDDNFDFMHNFKEEIVKAFNENPSTEHVLLKTEYLWEGRTKNDSMDDKGKQVFLKNLRLALTYGVMVDLGLRKPKYENKTMVNG